MRKKFDTVTHFSYNQIRAFQLRYNYQKIIFLEQKFLSQKIQFVEKFCLRIFLLKNNDIRMR